MQLSKLFELDMNIWYHITVCNKLITSTQKWKYERTMNTIPYTVGIKKNLDWLTFH